MARVSAHQEEQKLTSKSQAKSTGLQVKCLQGWSTLESDGCSTMSCSTRLQNWGLVGGWGMYALLSGSPGPRKIGRTRE